MVENIRCDTTRCTNESLQPIHHTREWDQTWVEPENRAVMGMASGVAALGRRVLAGGVRRLLWTVMTSAVATSVGQISHATFCGTARPLTHDHHSRAPPMFPDSPVMFPDAFATLSWPRIES